MSDLSETNAAMPAGIIYPAPGAARLIATKKIRVEGTTVDPPLVKYKPAHHQTVMQSLAFDNLNKAIFIAQLTNGGAERDKNGDLTITRWIWNDTLPTPGYEYDGFMLLAGFGHGVSIGVEVDVDTADTYLWTEVDNIPHLVPGTTDKWSGRGKNICRFKYVDAQSLTNTSPQLQKHTPVPGSTHNTVNIDPVYGRLVHRFKLDGEMRYRVHDLDKARQGIWNDYVADIQEPDPFVGVPRPPYQGYAVAGSYLYMLFGASYSDTNPPGGGGNAHLVSVNLKTGDIDTKFHTKAGHSLIFREPEGLSIRIPNPATPDVFDLGMGFACGEQGARTVTIYIKNSLVQG
ncbi:teichoic acid biosynthesis protein C [Streptomyces sp. NPDC020965]|uniref:phage baseplate protein n=1 Tax=Streptomyces sp. NPDC020965 TaxID=3365105 RepID=UPI0037BAD298